MTDKLEALSHPVFEIEVSGNTWLNCSAENLTPTERADFSDWPDGINKLYSQEYVTALLAALEEKDARAAACVAAFEGIETERIAGKNLGEFLAGEVRLNKAEPKPDGSFGFTFSGFAVQIMAEAFADQFKSSGAVNYLELLFEHKEIGPLTVTMQRVEGLTPSQKLAAAEQREEHLKATVDVLSAKNSELETGHGEAAKQISSWRNLAKQNIAEREKDIAALDAARQRIAELEQRLQQPITVEWQYPHWNDDEWSAADGILKYKNGDFCLVEIDGKPTVINGVKLRPAVKVEGE